jgi:hypothetical protein
MALVRGPLNSSSPTTSVLTGGVYNAVPPAPADTQECALQLDANGRLLVSSTGGGGATVVTGTLSNNTAPPGPNNVGVLPAVANAAAPTYIEGNQVLLSTDLSGNLRTISGAGSTTAVTGNVTVVQPTGTNLHVVVDSTSGTAAENLIQVAGVTLGATAVTAYGTAPAAANVPGVNAFITNTPAVTLASTTITGNVTVVQPTGTNLHVVVDSTTGTAAENLIQVAGVTLGATAVTAYGTAPAAANVPGVNAFITNTVATTLASTTITGTVAVTQSTTPWADNLTQVAGVALGATAVTAFGTAPAAANVPGVNSSIFAGTTGITATGTSLNVNITSGSLITAAVTGTKSNNSVVPGATNLGVLPGIANAVTQTWTEGDQVLESMDLSGRQRVRGTLTHNNAAPSSDLLGVMNGLANAVAPTYTEGDLVLQSVDLSGNTRVIGTKTNNNAAPTTQVGVLPALANAAPPAWTEGNQVLESVDLTGRQRVRGTLTNNNAAPAADQLSVIPALANAVAPAWTEGDQVLLSETLTGQLRTTGGAVTQGSTTAGEIGGLIQGAVTTANPLYTTGQTDPLSLDINGNLRTLLYDVLQLPGDNFGNLRSISDAGGNFQVIGTNPYLWNGGGFWRQRDILGAPDSGSGNGVTAIAPVVFNGTTWDRARSATIGNAVASTGLPANTAYGEYLSTAPAPTTGQYSALQTDYKGSLFTKPIRRSETVAQATTISLTASATTVLAAQAAGIFTDISNLIITVTTAATTSIPFTATLSDGTASYIFDMETGSLTTGTPPPLMLAFNPPISATTAATAWTIALSVATVVVHVTVNSVLQKAS